MSEEEINSSEKFIKECFVLLRKLDKKTLERYTNKKNDNSRKNLFSNTLITDNSKPLQDRTVYFGHYANSNKNWEEVCDNFTEELEKITLKSSRKGKKRKPKIIAKNTLNHNKNILEKTKPDEVSLESSQIEQNKLTNLKKRRRDTTTGNLKSTDGMNENQTVKKFKGETEKLQKTDYNCKNLKVPFGAWSQTNKQNPTDQTEVADSSNKNKFSNDTTENETEIIEVLMKSNKIQEKPICEETVTKKFARKQMTTEFECEDETRDDDEDDRATVIFEKSVEENIIDVEECIEMKRKAANFKHFNKNKKANRKKQNFGQFKPKIKRLTGNAIKLTKLYSDAKNQKQTSENVDENCIREFCCLVKRIHELYRIIFQLQKDLPRNRNTEQVDQFLRTVKTQEENFIQEIKKSQRSLVEGYDKMLRYFDNLNEMFWEISRRTSLSENDISNVISRCTLVEGTCEEMKQMEVSVRTENRSKITTNDKKGTALPAERAKTNASQPVQTVKNSIFDQQGQNNVSGSVSELSPPPFPFCVSGNKKTLLPKPNLDPQTGVTTLTRDLNSHQWNQYKAQRNNHTKTRPYFWSQNNHHYNIQNSTRNTQDLTRTNLNYTKSSRYSYNSMRTLYPHYNTNYSCSGHFGTPGGNMRIPSLVNLNPIEYNNTTFTTNQHPTALNPSTSILNAFQFLSRQQSFGYNHNPTKSYNRSSKTPKNDPNHTVPKPSPSGTRNSSSKHTVVHTPRVENNPTINTPINSSKETQSVNNSFDKTDKSLGEKKPPIIPVKINPNTSKTAQNLQTEPESEFDKFESSNLDPTVPQKLTMRDSKLQAGPQLEPDRDSDSNTMHLSWSEEKSITIKKEVELDNLIQNESHSRVYFCAQYKCKNLGVRICEGCMSIIYCSETCQLKHWTEKHKSECHQLKKLQEPKL